MLILSRYDSKNTKRTRNNTKKLQEVKKRMRIGQAASAAGEERLREVVSEKKTELQ